MKSMSPVVRADGPGAVVEPADALGQDAADFAVPVVEVVDPFDLRADAHRFLDGLRRGDGRGQGQLRERGGVEHIVVRADHGDVKAGVGGGVEGMSLPSSSGGLMVRDEVHAVVDGLLFQHAFRFVVRGVDVVEDHDFVVQVDDVLHERPVRKEHGVDGVKGKFCHAHASGSSSAPTQRYANSFGRLKPVLWTPGW